MNKIFTSNFLVSFLGAISILLLLVILVQELRFKKSEANSDAAIEADLIYLKLKNGVVVIETLPNIAPNHVARIKELVRQGFYDGNKFFRVIDGFVAQAGDPTGTGRGGSGKTLKAEFSNISHKRGIVSMARANDPNSADSQFFIVLQDSAFLDEKYTVWGRVISGMNFVDEIKKSKTGGGGMVTDPDIIISMALKKDIRKKAKEKLKTK